MKWEDRLPPFLTWIPKKSLILIGSGRKQVGCKMPPSTHLPRVFPQLERNMESSPSVQLFVQIWQNLISFTKIQKPSVKWGCTG